MSQTSKSSVSNFITQEQESKITEFIAEVKKKYNPLPKIWQKIQSYTIPDTSTKYNCERVVALNYLVAREWKLSDALDMFQNIVKLRAERNLDELALFPSLIPIFGYDEEELKKFYGGPLRDKEDQYTTACRVLLKYFPLAVHYWDKSGDPAVFVKLGQPDLPALFEELQAIVGPKGKPIEVVCDLVVYIVELMLTLVTYNQDLVYKNKIKIETPFDGILSNITIIIDMSGFGYKMLWKPGIDMIRTSAAFMFNHYPNMISRILCFNVSSIVRVAYNLIKVVFPKDVKKKVSFVSSSEKKAALLNALPEEHFSIKYGGSCICSKKNLCNLIIKVVGEDNPDQSTTVTVKSGGNYELNFPVFQHEEVHWKFNVLKKKSLIFETKFVRTKLTEENWEPELSDKKELTENSDMFVAPSHGTFFVRWTNPGSWFANKSLNYFIEVKNIQEAQDD